MIGILLVQGAFGTALILGAKLLDWWNAEKWWQIGESRRIAQRAYDRLLDYQAEKRGPGRYEPALARVRETAREAAERAAEPNPYLRPPFVGHLAPLESREQFDARRAQEYLATISKGSQL